MRLFLFVIALLLHFFVNAQAYTQENQLITSIKVNKDLPKRFDISAQYQIRFDEDIKNLKGSYFYASIKYGLIKKYLYTEFEYRYYTSHFEDRHRFGIGLQGKYKYNKITFSDKLFYEREHPYFNAAYEAGHQPTDYLRNRIQVKWDFKKHWDTYISFESFFKISTLENEFDELRMESGFEWEFIKHHTINLCYRLQQEINQSNPKLVHTIGIGYEWDIPKFKRKKSKLLHQP